MLLKLQQLRDAREEGFTLVELLIVIVIIGVLAAIAVPIFLNQQKAAIRAGMKSDLRSTIVAVQTMLVKNPKATDDRATGDTTPLLFPPLAVKANQSLSDSRSKIAITGEKALQTNGYQITSHDTASWDEYSVAIANNAARAVYVYNSTVGKTNIVIEDHPVYNSAMGSDGSAGYLLATQ